MQKINRAFFGVIIFTSFYIHAELTPALSHITERLQKCNSLPHDSDTTKCFKYSHDLVTYDVAVALINEEIISKTNIVNLLSEKLADTTLTSSRNRLQSLIDGRTRELKTLRDQKNTLPHSLSSRRYFLYDYTNDLSERIQYFADWRDSIVEILSVDDYSASLPSPTKAKLRNESGALSDVIYQYKVLQRALPRY